MSGASKAAGSKNLKAVTIRGWLDINVADIEECMKVAAEVHKKDEVIDPENEIYKEGTTCLVNYSQESGLLPTTHQKFSRRYIWRL